MYYIKHKVPPPPHIQQFKLYFVKCTLVQQTAEGSGYVVSAIEGFKDSVYK